MNFQCKTSAKQSENGSGGEQRGNEREALKKYGEIKSLLETNEQEIEPKKNGMSRLDWCFTLLKCDTFTVEVGFSFWSCGSIKKSFCPWKQLDCMCAGCKIHHLFKQNRSPHSPITLGSHTHVTISICRTNNSYVTVAVKRHGAPWSVVRKPQQDKGGTGSDYEGHVWPCLYSDHISTNVPFPSSITAAQKAKGC